LVYKWLNNGLFVVDIYIYITIVNGDYNILYIVYKPIYNYIKHIDHHNPHYNHNNGRVLITGGPHPAEIIRNLAVWVGPTLVATSPRKGSCHLGAPGGQGLPVALHIGDGHNLNSHF